MTTSAKHAALPWCCRHKWTMCYIAVVATAELLLQVLESVRIL